MPELWQALTKGGYEVALHYQIRKDYPANPLADSLEWYHPSDAYPTQIQVDAWMALVQAEETAQSNLNTAQSGLKDKAALAKTYASEIKTLWNVCLDQLETNSSHPTRFNAVKAAVDALPTALKNRVNKGTPDPLNASTDVLRDAYVDHVHLVAVSLALLLSRA